MYVERPNNGWRSLSASTAVVRLPTTAAFLALKYFYFICNHGMNNYKIQICEKKRKKKIKRIWNLKNVLQIRKC